MAGPPLMALLGAPITLKNASHRKMRSAMAIHGETTRFSENEQNGEIEQ
jgi:hypothetical protein